MGRVALGLSALVLFGAGCAAQVTSTLTAEEAAQMLSFASGAEVVLQPTVLGVGGQIVDWLGAESDERVVKVESWTVGESADLSWSITTQEETEASAAAREAHEAQYAETPIGEEIPDAPEVEYQDVVVEGTISTSALDDGDRLLLPSLWTEGEAGEVEETLIWLSRVQYDELVNTRKTTLSFGLFDESLAQIEDVADQVQSYIDQLATLIPGDTDEGAEEEVEEDLLDLEASGDWGEYTVTIDGVVSSVRVIEAKNRFGSLRILANAENPLVLEVQLTPFAQGNLETLTPDGFVEGFAGYEVTEIRTK